MITRRIYWSAYLAYNMIGQARYPFKPYEAIRRAQTRRLREIVKYAFRYVPFYRDIQKRTGLGAADIRSAEDLEKLPIIERRDLKEKPESFLSTEYPAAHYFRTKSAGSTGEPCPMYHDNRSLFLSAAHGERARRIFTNIIQKPFGYRETYIAPTHSSTQNVRKFWHKNALFPSSLRIKRQILPLVETPAKNLARINEFKPDEIHGFGSYISMLFAYIERTGAEFHRPKVVTYSSDGMPDSIRRLIMEKYGIPVFSIYQAVEMIKIGFECEHHKGLHLNIDYCPVRIVDAEGRTLAPGEEGEVVISNLINHATVLLNYRLGDVASILPEPCPCGRTLPLMTFPTGRIDDFIELPSGDIVHASTVRNILGVQEDVWKYQIVQESTTHIKIFLVVSTTCNRRTIEELLRKEFAQRLGDGVVLDIFFVDTIQRTAGGKFRSVISMHGRTMLNLPADSDKKDHHARER